MHALYFKDQILLKIYSIEKESFQLSLCQNHPLLIWFITYPDQIF